MTTTHTSSMTSAFSLKLLASCAVIGFGSLSAFASTQTIDTANTMTTTLGVLTDTTGCTLDLTNVGAGGATVAIPAGITTNTSSHTNLSVGANVTLQTNNNGNLPSAAAVVESYLIGSTTYSSTDASIDTTIAALDIWDSAAGTPADVTTFAGLAAAFTHWTTSSTNLLLGSTDGTGSTHISTFTHTPAVNAGQLTLAGGVLNPITADPAIANPVTLTASSMINMGHDTSISGIVALGANTLAVEGAHTLTLSGVNTGTGAIVVGTPGTGHATILDLTNCQALGGAVTTGLTPTVTGLTVCNGATVKVGATMTMPTIILGA